MSEHTPIDLLTVDTVQHRIDGGLYEPLESLADLKVVDCGDDRGVTPSTQMYREVQHGSQPGRLFAGAWGVSFSMLAAQAARDPQRSQLHVAELGPEAIVDFAAETASLAKTKLDIDLTFHSDIASEEGHELTIEDNDNHLGCAALSHAVTVAELSVNPLAMRDAEAVSAKAGVNLPLEAARHGIRNLLSVMPESGTRVHRGAVRYAINRHVTSPNHGHYVPVVVHDGEHAPNDQAKLTIDFKGVRSDAGTTQRADLKRYMHTPKLPAMIAPILYANISKRDEPLLQAASLLQAMGVRQALSGAENPRALELEVIPLDNRHVA